MNPREVSPPPGSLGERIRRLREDEGWSQRELAWRAGLKPRALSKYELGIYEPSLAAVKAIAGALHTTTDHLTGASGPETAVDTRLKSLLARLDELPAEQRSSLAEILDALLKIHHCLDTRSLSQRQDKPKKT
jgi:transcriptional regulator with XRE-family HTH domain